MEIDLTETLVESVLPNNLISVKGESRLSDRIAPYVDDAQEWLRSFVLGEWEPGPGSECCRMAIRAIVIRAVISAVPALDLVVTPSGFGVVSSSGLVPASRERIERLISRLTSYLDDIIVSLQELCLTDQRWRVSSMGQWYCATFLSSLRDALPLPASTDLHTAYTAIRGLALTFELAIAEEYIGMALMDSIRAGYHDGTYPASHPVVDMIRQAAARYVSAHLQADPYRCPDSHEIWHAARPILSRIRLIPELHSAWEKEMGPAFHPEPFRNTRQGGYFF